MKDKYAVLWDSSDYKTIYKVTGYDKETGMCAIKDVSTDISHTTFDVNIRFLDKNEVSILKLEGKL